MDWKSLLKTEVWEEGRRIVFQTSSYRHRVAVTCYALGRQTAEFANGIFNYGAYVELIRGDGSWIAEGNNIVPVLPDGRLIMVVEQRPAQGVYGPPSVIELEGQEPIDLAQFGPYSSLEFPGGAVDANERLSSSFLRELEEETGVGDQTATLFIREPYIFPAGADVALRGKNCVVCLSGVKFQGYVKNDGGLHVLALKPEDVQRNIWKGRLASAQTVLSGWAFYQELQAESAQLETMFAAGYVSRQEVKIKK